MWAPSAQAKRDCLVLQTWPPMFEIIYIEIQGAGQCQAESSHCLGTENPKWHLNSIGRKSDHLPDCKDQVDQVADKHDHVDVQGNQGKVCFLIAALYLSGKFTKYIL